MSKFAKVALTVAAAGGALVAGVVLIPRLLGRGTTPAKPAPMTNAPTPPPAPIPARPPSSVPSNGVGGTLNDINTGINVANSALDVLGRLGLGNDDGTGFSFGGFSF